MKNLKFRYIAARNFLPFGPDGIEIYFDDYGQITLIQGCNLDIGSQEFLASNGVGKSSIFEIISYALYGQTVKRPKKLDHDHVVNRISKSDMMVEVQFDDYRVVRTRKTNTNKVELWKSSNHLWDNSTKVTKGKGVQEQINEAIGLSHLAFCNVVVFDDSNTYSFLELDTEGKRKVIENLLGLDCFREYQDSAKKASKEQKLKIKDFERDYTHLKNSLQESINRIEQIQIQEENWRNTQKNKLAGLKARLHEVTRSLSECNNHSALLEYQNAQEQAGILGDNLTISQEKRTKLMAIIQEAEANQDKLGDGFDALLSNKQSIQTNLNQLNSTIQEAKRKLAELKNLNEGARCPTCHGTVNPNNYGSVVQHERNIAEAALSQKLKEEELLTQAEEKISNRKANIAKLRENLAEAKKRLSALDMRIASETKEMNKLLSLPKPILGVKEQTFESEIVSLKKQIEEKQVEITSETPYKEILEQAISDRDAKKIQSKLKGEELKEAEEKLPYYDFWVEAFGDKGIRKQVVDGIIPALNSRVSYWLQFLIDSKIQLTFDNQLSETITRNGVEAYYHAMSNGEKRRINLAVSQAFAYVMMLNSGHCPSIVFMDEITGGGIDNYGIEGIYNMIFELAKERQVFVTTHNQGLLHMLQGCECINLVKEKDITTLSKS